MKAFVYNPYLDTIGGGERYTLSVARVFCDLGYEVDLLWDEGGILKRLGERFGMDVLGIEERPNFLKEKGVWRVWRRWRLTREYGLGFVVSDGSVPLLFCKKSLLHFQVPFHGVGGKSWLNKLKLRRYRAVVCNSKLTRRVVRKEYGVKGVVVYPPVATDEFKAGKKENLILCVGRFSQLKQAKRQDVLIGAFRKMVDEGLKEWKLVLAGGSEVGKGDFFEKLVELAKGYPVEIVENPSFSELNRFYGKAKMFWSAAGFGVDEEGEPEKLEHFGMAVVEAMAAGAVPVVYWAGGHKEIVRRGRNGGGWRTERKLIAISYKLIADQKKWNQWSCQATDDAGQFCEANFRRKIEKLLE